LTLAGFLNNHAFALDSTSVSVTSSYSTVNAGGSLALNISVNDTSSSPTNPTGTVSLIDGGGGGTFSPATCTLSSGACTVSYTAAINALPVTITASYSGDSTHAASSGTLSITVIRHTTNTVLTANQTSINLAGSVKLFATVSDTSSNPTIPTGTLAFTDNRGGTFNATSCTVSQGGCTILYTLGSSSQPNVTITASYGGDTSHSTSTGTVSLTVNIHTSSVTIAPTHATLNAGGIVTVNGTVTDTSSSPITPSGTLSFSDNGAGGTFNSTPCTLVSGRCIISYTVSTTAPSTVTITGSYSGDSAHATSTATSSLTVIPLRSTGTTITPSSATLNSRTPFTFTVAVADTLNSTKIPSGVVSLTDSNSGGTFSPTSCTLSSGNCTSSYTPGPSLQSTVTVTATYLGDSTHATSYGTSRLSISILHSTSVSIGQNQTALARGTLKFNATVSDTSGSQTTPTGTISWDDNHAGGTFLPESCNVLLNSCTASYTSAVNAPSSITITATYSGDSTHTTSTGTLSLLSGVQSTQSTTSTSSPQSTTNISIPPWVRNNALWWHDGTIGDSDFEKGIQYLIQQGIMKIPATQSGNSTVQGVPAWVKNNAGWWAQGTISDDDFIKGIQYLIEQGIIKV